MFRLPKDTEAEAIARARLGVYVVKFFHEGKDRDGRWEYNQYSGTVYRLDYWKAESHFYNFKTYKRGLGLTKDPKSYDYFYCMVMDMELWDEIYDEDVLKALQNYLDSYGYDKDDDDWLNRAMDTVRAARDCYDEILELLGENFKFDVAKVQAELEQKTGEHYEYEEIFKLLCYDPVSDMEGDVTGSELSDIIDMEVDYDDIQRRYGNA